MNNHWKSSRLKRHKSRGRVRGASMMGNYARIVLRGPCGWRCGGER